MQDTNNNNKELQSPFEQLREVDAVTYTDIDRHIYG